MILEQISCLNYRNIAECNLRFSPKFNCFLGNNGMGKTNLLDAIYYLSLTKSHLNPLDSQLVRHNEPFLMVEGQYDFDSQKETIKASIRPRVKKTFSHNGKAYTRISDHIGLIPIVLIAPSDQQLIADGSEERRRFIDIVISQCDPRYLNTLTRYNNILKNRNDLLKQLAENTSTDSTLLDIYDCQLNDEAQYIYAKRNEFIEKFVPIFQHYYTAISGSSENVSLSYSSHLQQGPLTPLLQQTHDRDLILGYTTRGIHKDDLIMTIDGYPIKNTGSQGQNKSYVTAMKLAQYVYLQRHHNRKPILLLDDVFDRLDATRVSNIIEIVSSDEFGQIFITDTTRNHTEQLLASHPSAIFQVHDGTITPLDTTPQK